MIRPPNGSPSDVPQRLQKQRLNANGSAGLYRVTNARPVTHENASART